MPSLGLDFLRYYKSEKEFYLRIDLSHLRQMVLFNSSEVLVVLNLMVAILKNSGTKRFQNNIKKKELIAKQKQVQPQ